MRIAIFFAQRVSATGDMHWNANGIPICDLPSSQSWPLIVNDTMGGAVLVLGRTRDTTATRTAMPNASMQTAINYGMLEGVPVCTHPTLQDDLNAIADGKRRCNRCMGGLAKRKPRYLCHKDLTVPEEPALGSKRCASL